MTIPWDDLRLSQVEDVARHCDDACRADVLSLVVEVRRLREALEDIKLRYDDEGTFAARDMWRVAHETLDIR